MIYVLGRPIIHHQKRRWRSWIVAFVLLCALVAGAVYWLSSPAKGRQVAVDTALSSNPTKTSTPKITPAMSLNNQYFNLQLPPGYTQTAQSTSVPDSLWTGTLLKSGALGSQIISIDVKALPAGGLSGDSSYALRAGQPSVYKQQSQTYGGQTVTIFSRDDQELAETVAFWAHGQYMATISVTGGVAVGDDSDSLKTLDGLLSAWSWQ